METPLRAFLWISLASHVVGAAMILWHARRPTTTGPSERNNATPSETIDAPLLGVDSLGDESTRTAQPSSLAARSPLPHSLPAGGEGGRNEALSLGAGEAPPASGEGRSGANAGSSGGESGIAVFGAIGDRAAVDLATAFTRGFPQVASADPAWATAPFGAAGEAIVTLKIDGEGAWVGGEIEGSPSAALRAGVARTLALLRARAFTASGPVTRLRVTAKVSPDEMHDGLHGEVFAIGGSFDATQGSAFFALAIGRRIDLQVRRTR
jgi:hypothetical protein